MSLKRRLRLLLTLPALMLVAGLIGGCSSIPDYSFSRQFALASKTFQHSNGYRYDRSLADLLSMARQFLTHETDPIEKTGFAVVSISDNAPRGIDKIAIIRTGHATLLFEAYGKTILTDPMFSDRASPLAFSGPKAGSTSGQEP